jgi:ligand-binding sensor domain-containing protein
VKQVRGKRLCGFAVLTLVVAAQGLVNGQTGDWKSFTSMRNVVDMATREGVVWGVTDGGVLAYDPSDGAFQTYTNTEGLLTNDVRAAEVDRSGRIWFGLGDGRINILDPEDGTWDVVDDYRGLTITDIVSHGDSVYVGLNIGVSLYVVDRREVKETYKNLGVTIPVEITANSVFLRGEEIWVGTPAGLAKSSLTLPNLLAPQSWTNFTTSDGLPSNDITAISALDTIIYVGTERGVARWSGSGWEAVATGMGQPAIVALSTGLSGDPASERIFAATATSVFMLDDQGVWQHLGDPQGNVLSMTAKLPSQLWIGAKGVGFAQYDFNQDTWTALTPNTPASNVFTGLTLDSTGTLWAASGQRGIHILRNDSWINLSQDDGLPSSDMRAVAIGPDGHPWFGSWGGGLTVVEETAGGFTFKIFDETNGLAGTSGVDPGFVVVRDIQRDLFGNLWLMNYIADNTKAVVAVPASSPDNWAYFSTSEGLRSIFVTVVTTDRFGRVWIGTESSGVSVLDDAGTLFDKSDDDFTQGLSTDDGLLSNYIRALAVDQDGVVWIATDKGLNFWFEGSVGERFGLISDDINVIAVDPRNNKWIGTSAGISVLSSDGVTWTHYTTENSPLVSNNILSLAFDEQTGDVYIGTTAGLSKYRTPFTAPREDLSLVRGYPNPFIVDDSDQNFIIDNLTSGSRVNIYNVAGELVQELPESSIVGAQARWDGRSDSGDVVPSGIYVYLVYTNGGLTATGKVAVVRR